MSEMINRAGGGYRGRVTHPSFAAFIDESSAVRSATAQEYLVCSAIIPEDAYDAFRTALSPLRLPGQIKLHWTDESPRRRREIVTRIAELGPMNVVLRHLDARRRKVERYRRKCLESLYHELVMMEVFDLTLECRTEAQDRSDRAHIVALQGQGLDRRVRIQHRRGGDEPLLWIADVVLGAMNSAELGDPTYLDVLKSTILLETCTPDSDTGESERP